jgi:hypothetical protein
MKPKPKQPSEPSPQADGATHSTDQPMTAVDNEQVTSERVTLTELQAENEQLKAAIRLDAAHRQITGELAAAGARSPELLFDAVKGDLQFGDGGALENAAAIVARLKAGFPEQFGAGQPASIDAGSGQTAAPRLTRDALQRMKPSEIAELDWNDVKRVLASN